MCGWHQSCVANLHVIVNFKHIAQQNQLRSELRPFQQWHFFLRQGAVVLPCHTFKYDLKSVIIVLMANELSLEPLAKEI